jgi:hypothetical protein
MCKECIKTSLVISGYPKWLTAGEPAFLAQENNRVIRPYVCARSLTFAVGENVFMHHEKTGMLFFVFVFQLLSAIPWVFSFSGAIFLVWHSLREKETSL